MSMDLWWISRRVPYLDRFPEPLTRGLALAVDVAGARRPREGKVVEHVARISARRDDAADHVLAGNRKRRRKLRKCRVDVGQWKQRLLAFLCSRIEQRGFDLHPRSDQRLDGKCIEAALQLLAAVENDLRHVVPQ